MAIKYLRENPDKMSLSKRQLRDTVVINGRTISDATWHKAKKEVEK